jgi:ABC-2 type transport system permease protein
MFVTPIQRTEYLIGKVAPYLLLAIAQLMLVAIVGLLWFKVPFHGAPLVALTGVALFMLSAIGLGLLVSLISSTRQQAQQAVLFLMLPFMVLSGFIFPISSMPDAIKPVTYAIPLRYALDVLRGAAVKGAGFADLAVPLLALSGFGIVIFTGAVIATRRKLS